MTSEVTRKPGRLRRALAFCWRHKVLSLLVIVAIGLLHTPFIVLGRTYGIVHPDETPSATPTAFELEVQTEPDTCGLHALSTLYHAYGLDAEAERLRWRIGIDTKALFWHSESTGALHPDLWMVLNQDGFAVQPLEAGGEKDWLTLLNHLSEGHPALILIRRRETGGLHWVLATSVSDEQLTIYDPLFPEPLTEDRDYWEDHVLTVWTIRPTNPTDSAASSWDAHRQGADEALVATARYQDLK